MKKLGFFILVLLLATSVIAQEAKIEKTFISVTGMNCNMCSGKVEKALGDADGVLKAVVGLEKAIAYVEYDPAKTSLKKLESAIVAVGFGANDQKPVEAHMKMEENEAMHEKDAEKAEHEHGDEMKMVTLIGEGDMNYTCSMSEHMVFSATADVKCPECGMKLKEMTDKDKKHLETLLKTYKTKNVKK